MTTPFSYPQKIAILIKSIKYLSYIPFTINFNPNLNYQINSSPEKTHSLCVGVFKYLSLSISNSSLARKFHLGVHGQKGQDGRGGGRC